MPACELDHIVIAAASLEDGADYIRERLGVEIPAGGRHESMGTHNRLMRLGPNRYLEVIAINPSAAAPDRPRWYALDEPEMRARLEQGPALITWVLRTADIIAAVQAAAVPLGAVTSVSREMLSWRLTVPADGHLPGGGVLPHLIEWDGGARPWEALPDQGFALDELTLTHPDPDWLAGALRTLCARGFSSVTVVAGDTPGLSARISTPAGDIVVI